MKDLDDKIDSKLDCDVFDNEIASIRALIGEMDDKEKNKIEKPQVGLGPGGNGGLNSKEISKFRELLEKFP
jgi:hypothetical protein